MQPIESIEYELTTEMATDIQRTLLHWELRRGWRRDVPVFIGALLFIALIVWLGLGGWILPSVGGGLACIVVLFVIRIVLPATSVSSELDALIRAKAEQTMVPMHTI